MKRYGIWAIRSGNSMVGEAATWCKKTNSNGEIEMMEFDSMEEVMGEARNLNEGKVSLNISYEVKEIL